MSSKFPSEVSCLRPVILPEFLSPKGPEMLLIARLRNIFHLPRRQLKRDCPQVVAQSLLLRAGSNGHDILINAPSQRNLTLANVVLLRQRANKGINWTPLCPRNSCQGPISCNGDVVLLLEGYEIPVLQVRMKLDLVNRRGDLSRLQSSLQMFLQIIRHPNALRLSRSLHILHGLPRTLQITVGLGEERSMDEIEIHVVQPQLFQARVYRTPYVGDIRDDLRGHEKFLTGYPAFLDCLAELGLSVVDFGTVEVVVAHFDGSLDRFDEGVVDAAVVGFLVPGCACAVAELARS
jgi:hypothetical protein